jgi:hypothetical protein
MKSSFHTVIHFLAFLLNYSAHCQPWRLSQFSAATTNSGTQPTSNSASDPRYIASGRTHRKRRFLHCCVLIHCCRDVYALLRSNERGVDHRKHRCSVAARVRFRGNVFTEPLPSNELFRLSGVISQYIS